MTSNSKQDSSVADLARAMGHTLRIQILQELIIGSCIVSELMDTLAVEASLLSKHLAVLREAGLIECETEWRCRRYDLRNPEAVAAALKALNEALQGSGK
ncbi:MAG: winged helix-turn-helix domain-containing protein [Candidatus Fermentibacteria bacterium]|nr:winged helix-turn-helix domain-containing protein [Candidatus Fermentibacteria bacterium]